MKNDVTDNYCFFILNFKQYENAYNASLVYFGKTLLVHPNHHSFQWLSDRALDWQTNHYWITSYWTWLFAAVNFQKPMSNLRKILDFKCVCKTNFFTPWTMWSRMPSLLWHVPSKVVQSSFPAIHKVGNIGI